ncbi:MAG: 2-hydroxyacyl-CoA dehydratase subunit D [Candidatus Binatia bacterium]
MAKKLRSLEELEETLRTRPEELKQERRAGRKVVGYFCNYVPEELIHAAGAIPLRLGEGGQKEAEREGGEYITANSCSFAKSCIGGRARSSDPFLTAVDCIAEAPACVQMEWVLEVWEEYFGVPVLPIGLPRKFDTAEGLDYYLEELVDFRQRLERFTERPITQVALEESVELYNGIRKKLNAIYGFLREDTSPISWEEGLEVVQAGFVLHRQCYLKLLEAIWEECQESLRHIADAGMDTPGPRLLVAGSILAPGDKKLLDVARELGANIVMDELCTGSRWFWNDVEEPSLEGLARRCLLKPPCATLPDIRKEGNVRREHLKQLIQEWRIDGVVYYTLRFCDAYSFKVEADRHWLEEMGISLLHINSEYSSINQGQIRTRLEAFMELLEAKMS